MRRRTFTNGDRFGKIVVLKTYDPENIENAIIQCDCGTQRSVRAGTVGRSLSCGCTPRGTHRMTRTPEYVCWVSMLQRCQNPNASSFADYGGRGIRVCYRWQDFTRFYADMGDRPSPKHSIGRINNDGNYEPANCRWETADQQAYNKRTTVRIDVRGAELIVPDAAKALGKSTSAVYADRRARWHMIKVVKRKMSVTRQDIENAEVDARKFLKRRL